MPISEILVTPSVTIEPPARISAKEIELTRSRGIVSPITVRHGHAGYELLVGARTLRLARFAKLTTIPAYLLADVNDDQAQSLLEIDAGNTGSVLDDARMLQQLTHGGMSMTHAAATVGCGRQQGYQLLSLLSLSDEVQKLVASAELTVSIARLLTKLDGRTQLGLARTAIREGLSTRAVRALIDRRAGKMPTTTEVSAGGDRDTGDADTRLLCEELTHLIGSPVKIIHQDGAGSVRVVFANAEILAGQIERLAEAGQTYQLQFDDRGVSGVLVLPFTSFENLDRLLVKFGWSEDN